ncbi:MAG: hypothetical protein JSW52_11285 [Candidatus Coatesbacteria bacterium]|nr:MAG: hypothetical protein JSW52_11285 [Candidatus Coatesbacteria bacterium]
MRLITAIMGFILLVPLAFAGEDATAGEASDAPDVELEEYFTITETTAHVLDFSKNEEYDAQVFIFEPKEENLTEDETAPYVIVGERPKPSVSFVIGHPDLSIDSKHMTIFMNAPPETLPEDLRRIYFGGRMETEPSVEPTPEHMEGLAKP